MAGLREGAKPGKDADQGKHGTSEVERLVGKVAAGSATEGEKKRLGSCWRGRRRGVGVWECGGGGMKTQSMEQGGGSGRGSKERGGA